LWGADAEKYGVDITLFVSQEELNTLREKGLIMLLGGN